MSFCTYCGKEITQQSAFCHHCGKPLSQKTAASNNHDCYTDAPLLQEQPIPLKMPFDKIFIAKSLLIVSCTIICILFFTDWYMNGNLSFSPFERAIRIAQFNFNGREVRIVQREVTVEDAWGGTRVEPVYGDKHIIDPGFLIFDIALTAMLIISLVLLLKVVYNISRKNECGIIYLYNMAMQMTIITCIVAFVFSAILNNVTREISYGSGDFELVEFKSSISFTFSYYTTVIIAIISRVFISHYFKDSIRK